MLVRRTSSPSVGVLVDGLEVRRTLKASVANALATKNSEQGRRPGIGTSEDADYCLARLRVERLDATAQALDAVHRETRGRELQVT